MLPLSTKLQALDAADPRAPSELDRDYWLCRCQGFTVHDENGRVGTVDHVSFTRKLDRPDTLAVRVGLLRRHLATVPVAAVDQIDPKQRRLSLTPPRPGRDRRGGSGTAA